MPSHYGEYGIQYAHIAVRLSCYNAWRIQRRRRAFDHDQLSWYTYGLPLVGEEVLAQPEDVAQFFACFQGMAVRNCSASMASRIKGQGEFARLFGERHVECALDGAKSAGPCTVILLGIAPDNESQAQKFSCEILRNYAFLKSDGACFEQMIASWDRAR